MDPVLADFATRPAELLNAVVRHHRCVIASSYVAVAAGGHLTVDFSGDSVQDGAETVLRLTVLGAAVPLDVVLNDETVTEGFSLPDDGDPGGERECVLSLPDKAVRQGVNVLRIRNACAGDEGDSLLRIRAITVDPARSAGRAERALAARTDARSVRVFATERRTLDAPVWQPGPRLLFHLDGGEGGPSGSAGSIGSIGSAGSVTRLSWRTTDGAESAVAFRSDLSGFHGHFRTGDGAIGELRGTLTERRAAADGTAGVPGRYFATEEERDGVWRPVGRLCLLLDDGGAPVERVTWSDRGGDATSLTLRTAVTGTAVPSATGERRDVTGKVSEVVASEEFEEWGEVAANLLRKASNKWLAHEDTADLEFTFEGPVAVTAYRLTSANDCSERDPADWVLEGSHDGRGWARLDARENEEFARRFDTREFSFANSVGYRHYRLRITANSGGHETQLSRVQFFGAEAGDTPARPGVCDFIGYRQHVGGEPVGYRGTDVPAPGPVSAPGEENAAPEEQLLAADFSTTAQDLENAARLLTRLTTYLRP
ncbi:discoidin domain-containing protein [Streptomyces beigongshangae]|uniref:discoidin domain-containing protein n=1 Tax=Streptomyces beigongshangae TaxID=2841597 RepID=UPI001C8556D2|nr:discoidin domain-containing protein [Streptomyces sp. REN17]